jgi:hypothetical protein
MFVRAVAVPRDVVLVQVFVRMVLGQVQPDAGGD